LNTAGETAFNYQTGQVKEKVKLTSGGIAGLVIGSIGLLVGGVTMNSASDYIEKAVITYNNKIKSNREFDETDKSSSSQSTASNFEIRISPAIDFSQAGVSLKLAF
jgi:ABC-type lipoprotein release transport system permease subunit